MRGWVTAFWLASACSGPGPAESDLPPDSDETDADTDVAADTDPPIVIDPADVRIVGFAAYPFLVGDYWAGAEASGEVRLAFPADPVPDPDVLGLWVGDVGCDTGTVPTPFMTFDVVASLHGPRSDVHLLPADGVYAGALLRTDFAVDEPYDLLPMDTVDGTDAADGVFAFDGVMGWDGPPLGNRNAPQGGPEDLAFTWIPSLTLEHFSHVLIAAELFDAGGSVTRTVYCLADASTGEITFPPSLWTESELATASGWYVGVGGVRVDDAKLHGDRGSSRFMAWQAEWGQLLYPP
jgi:hypothetical protein